MSKTWMSNVNKETRHCVLVQIMSPSKKLEDVKNPRLRALKDRTLMWSFDIKHIPGEKNVGPDVMSRVPGHCSQRKAERLNFLQCLSQAHREGDSWSDEMEDIMSICAARTYSAHEEFRAVTWDRVKEKAIKDDQCERLSRYINVGFPENRADVTEDIRGLWHLRDDLYVMEQVPKMNGRIFIPQSLRREVLEALHCAHQGEVGMKSMARGRFFWPQMDSQIVQTRYHCRTCNGMTPSQPAEELLEQKMLDFPFEICVTDFFQLHGRDYVLYADRLTRWVEIYLMVSTKFSKLVTHLRHQFQQ